MKLRRPVKTPLVILCLVLLFTFWMSSIVSTCYVESNGMRYSRGPLSVAEEVEGRENDEKRLLRHLMRGYERDVRPVKNASTPVVIQLSITLTQIFDMDEKNQVLTSIVWLDQEWKDELLTWDPNDFGGLKIMRMPCERIWLPDIVLYNNADDYTRGYMNSKAMVSYDGNVFWPPPTKFRSTCPVDVTYFPFDDQTCVMKLGSWTYDGFQVDVTNRTSEVDLTNYVPNGEWELLEARLIRNVVFYSCCPEPFPDLTVTLKIRRKILYYMVNVVLPCVMMSVLTLLVFCLPPESGEKIALGITVLLAFSVFMLAIAEKMPETSESIPLIGIYLTAVMAITSISVVMTVIVLNCHYKGPTAKQIPRWVKRYMLKSNVGRFNDHHQKRPTAHYQAFEEAAATAGANAPVVVQSGNCLGNGCRHKSVMSSSSASRENIPSAEFMHSGGVAGDGVADNYRGLPNTASSVSTIPMTLSTSANPQSFRLRVAEYSEERKRSFVRLSRKYRQAQQSKGAQTESEDDYGEARLSISVPTSSLPHPTLSMPSVGDTALESGGLCQSCRRTGGVGGPGCAKTIHPPYAFNMSTSNNDPDNMMRYFLDRQKFTEEGQAVVIEWRQLAATVDRILFWVFCVMTSVSSALFLIIIPGYNRGWFNPKPL
ncbi:Acetylcholine receptor protein alpha [Daphnia magna]|uniref:Acetylcholine receptor protein alpha n=1 Tax=Daphnia magna TaxID=35525 RepID=A0A0P6E6M4_9CRUS|nr:Acetylcholine receptor protein alpha [Daphnia magna]